METVRISPSSNRFQDIVGLISDWVWEVDANGIYTYCGGGIQEVLGYRAEEVVGRTPFDLMPDDERERIAEIFVETVKQNAPIVNLENWNIAKDGSEVCLLTNGVPFFDVRGDLMGYRGIDKDITEQKRHEKRLTIEVKQLLSIFDHINSIIYIADPQSNKILFSNDYAKQIFGQDLIGKKCHEAFFSSPDLCDFCTNEIILKDPMTTHTWEYYIPIIDRHFEAVDRIIKWPDGRDVRMEFAIDVTDRKTKQ